MKTTLFQTSRITALLPEISTFLQEELMPLEHQLINMPFNEAAVILEEKRNKIKNEGWWAPFLSKEHGGMGLSLVEFAQVSEILGTTPFGHYIFNCQAPDVGNMELMLGHASEELKQKYLEPLINGDTRSCFSMTEPEFAGSNPVQMATTAAKEANKYVINGHKWFTTAADGAAFAIVMAVTDPDAPNPYQRASMILVPTDTEGFELVRNISVMGHAGKGHHSHAEIRYNNCRVPTANLIGREGEGFVLAQERLGPGRIHHCMRWIGICERAFDMMCKRAATRDLGNGLMLGNKQIIQQWIAESRAEIDSARLLVLHAAHKIDEEGAKAARQEISTIKFYVANVLQKVLDRSIQAHGALGITDDLVLSFWYRHERAARIYDGPDEVHKASLAKLILKEYGLNVK